MPADTYIKLYRKALDNGWLQHAELWTFWCWCLLKATWKECVVMVGFQRINLLPGQFIFGRKQAAKELKLSEQTIRTCCLKLEKLKNITIKSTNKFSVISVINWDTYQGLANEINQQTNQQLTNKSPTTNHKQEYKERKECKEEKKKDPSKSNGALESFNLFWQAYPKKEAKKGALSCWVKLNPSPELLEEILKKIDQFKETPQWKKDNGQFIPLPTTWLNGKRWEDEGVAVKDWREF